VSNQSELWDHVKMPMSGKPLLDGPYDASDAVLTQCSGSQPQAFWLMLVGKLPDTKLDFRTAAHWSSNQAQQCLSAEMLSVGQQQHN
jgi:hypothetical protein